MCLRDDRCSTEDSLSFVIPHSTCRATRSTFVPKIVNVKSKRIGRADRFVELRWCYPRKVAKFHDGVCRSCIKRSSRSFPSRSAPVNVNLRKLSCAFRSEKQLTFLLSNVFVWLTLLLTVSFTHCLILVVSLRWCLAVGDGRSQKTTLCTHTCDRELIFVDVKVHFDNSFINRTRNTPTFLFQSQGW